MGGGGREHAIVWKLGQSPLKPQIYCAPGNAGIAELAACAPIGAKDVAGIVEFSRQNKIDLVIVGPDDPLMLGLVDALEAAGISAFGPTKAAALIEGSKVFAKELMRKYSIPTADYKVFEDSEKALEYLSARPFPAVIKAEGLALGKGVIIAEDIKTAQKAISDIMDRRIFGEAGKRVVIEEYLKGPEISVLAFTDGESISPMPSAQDHKRALDGDLGLNTGGMGAFSPSMIYDEKMHNECMEKIFLPTLRAMNAEGRRFKGVLYFGLMATERGVKVIEYNARFGDPETQAILPLLKTDILEIFLAVTRGELGKIKIKWEDKASACVIAASGGYPGEYKTGYEITGADKAGLVFHSGTKREDNRLKTNGGRVLGAVATASDLKSAGAAAYLSLSNIHFEKMHFRKDIGKK